MSRKKKPSHKCDICGIRRATYEFAGEYLCDPCLGFRPSALIAKTTGQLTHVGFIGYCPYHPQTKLDGKGECSECEKMLAGWRWK